MPGSTAWVFSERDVYQAALRQDVRFEFVVTGQGEFRAELTRLELARMYLVAGAESLARIAFIGLPADLIRITLPTRGRGPLFWAGAALRADEIASHTEDLGVHERTDGSCRWRTIWLPAPDLLKYGRAMLGRAFHVPSGVHRWRPPSEALGRLSRLHDDATRMSKVQPLVLAGAEATRGMEQELTDALIGCMREKTTDENAAISSRPAEIMSRFEDILQNYPHRAPSITDICAALDVPDRTFRAHCKTHLGMGPHRYLHLRQMQLARRALRGTDPGDTRISDIAHRYGFVAQGRFAAAYHKQFGELPSDTMQRRASR